MSTKSVFSGILAGFAVGATLGILFAPDKGSTTRTKISKKSQGYIDELNARFSEVVKELTEKIESVSEEAGQMVRSGESRAKDMATKISDKLA